MMDSRFNPYRDWLGLAQVPRNHYELLQLPLGESADERIRSAAARALSTLRRIKPGRRQTEWSALLDELEDARDCLLTAANKAAYDQRLRLQTGNHTPARPASTQPAAAATTPPHADPMAPVDFARRGPAHDERGAEERLSTEASTQPPINVDTDRIPGQVSVARRRRTRRRSVVPRSPLLTYGIVAGCFVGVVGTFVAVMLYWILPRQQQRAQQQAAIPASARDLPLSVEEAAATIESSTDALPPSSTTTLPATPSTLAADSAGEQHESDKPSAPQLDATQTDAALRDAYAAIVDRRWQDADRALAQARNGQTAARERAARFAQLKDYAQQYWDAVEDGLSGLQGSELEIEQTRLFVVEVNASDVLVRAEGRNRRFPRDALPDKLAMAIADRWFDEHAKSTPVFRGAMLLVSPRFSPDEARAAWQTAQQSGVELGDLMLIFDDLDDLGLTAEAPASGSGPLQLGDQ